MNDRHTGKPVYRIRLTVCLPAFMTTARALNGKETEHKKHKKDTRCTRSDASAERVQCLLKRDWEGLMAVYVVTGGGGFIGSHIVEELLRRNETVRVIDNFSTGKRENLHGFAAAEVIEADISQEKNLAGA